MITKMTKKCLNVAPEDVEETLSLPDFHFIKFVGLEGFNPSTCSWSPIDCHEYCSTYDDEPVISDRGEYKSFQTRPKKIISAACTYDQKSKKKFVHLPRIPGVKTFDKSANQRNHGQLIYDDEKANFSSPKLSPHPDQNDQDDDVNLQRKLDRLRVFGGERTNCYNNNNNNNGRGNKNSSTCSLPPLTNNASVRRSTSLPSRNSIDGSCKKNNFHQESNNNRVPWQGPNSKGIYSNSLNPCVTSQRKWKLDVNSGSQIRRCGGGGFATAVNNQNRKDNLVFPAQSRGIIFCQNKSPSNVTPEGGQKSAVVRGMKSRGVDWR